MKWPLVSRGRLEEAHSRLEDTQRRLTAADAERVRLQEMLLGARRMGASGGPMLVPPVEVVEVDEAAEEQAGPQPYTTPMDKLQQRFAMAHGAGKRIDARFRVRLT